MKCLRSQIFIRAECRKTILHFSFAWNSFLQAHILIFDSWTVTVLSTSVNGGAYESEIWLISEPLNESLCWSQFGWNLRTEFFLKPFLYLPVCSARFNGHNYTTQFTTLRIRWRTWLKIALSRILFCSQAGSVSNLSIKPFPLLFD